MKTIFDHIIERQNSSEAAILCTVVKTLGSTPLKAGAKMLVTETEFFGTVGGGLVERKTIDKAKELLISGRSDYFIVELNSKSGSTCGGIVELFLEPINMKNKLYIFGAGHVGKELAAAAQKLDFDITVIDNRKEIFKDWQGINCRSVCIEFDEFLNDFISESNSFIAILTYDHNIDIKIISKVISQNWHYLGLMGSKNKVHGIRKRLTEQGVSEDLIAKVDMPIGLDIKAESAPEIAVSICAKLIRERASIV